MNQTNDFFLLLVGTLLGVISSYLTLQFTRRENINQKLLEQYFKMREKIGSIISFLTTMNTHHDMTEEVRKKVQEDLYKVTYENYDFLPNEVLDALITLYVCLERYRGELYKVENKKIIVVKDKDKIH